MTSSIRYPFRPFGDLVEWHNNRRVPVKSSERSAGPYAYYGASGVADWVDDFLFDGLHLLVSEDGENLRSRTAPIAFLADGRFWVNNHAHVVRGNANADTRFLSYAFAVADVTGHISGSAQPKLSRGELEQVLVVAPPVRVQQAIAEVLGALDDKIAANDRLAEVADELLTSEFARLLDSASASVVTVGDLADVNNDQVRPGEGSLRYLDIANVSVGGYRWPEPTPWIDAPGRARRRLLEGDVIWSSVRPNRRSHGLVLDNSADLVGSTGLAVMRATTVHWSYLYEATRRDSFATWLVSSASGSAYPAVPPMKFKEAPLELMPSEQRLQFEALAEPIRRSVHAQAVESRTLANLRDALLPELMSGRLKVKDAEATVEEVL